MQAHPDCPIPPTSGSSGLCVPGGLIPHSCLSPVSYTHLALPVDYRTKKDCCGGAILGVDEETALSMARAKLDDINNAGADAINLICAFCSVMYGANQRKIGSGHGVKYDLPILYYPQILGLAMGISHEELGLMQNPIRPRAFLAKIS